MGSVNGMAQATAVASLSEMDLVRARVNEVVRERGRVAAGLAEMGIFCLPSGANFLLARIDTYGSDNNGPEVAEAMVVHLFDSAGLVVNRTREAGLESFFRFCLSLPAHNNLLLEAARGFMAGLSR
jgi:histidinol-phosphate aminotransferase